MIAKERERKTVVKTGKAFLGLVSLSILLYSQFVFAGTTVVSVVDRNELAVGQTFILEVRVSSDQDERVGAPEIPQIQGATLVGQDQQSSSRSSVVATGQGIDIKNLKETNYRYEFMAQQKGPIKIAPILLQSGGKKLSTQAITLNVLEKGAQVAQRNPRRRGSRPGNLDQDDPLTKMEAQFNQLLRRHFGGGGTAGPGSTRPGMPPGGFSTAPKGPNHAFFVLAEVDKTEAYKGEQIVASWYMYTQGNVREIDTLKYPSLKGFWKEDIQISTHLAFEKEIVNGIPYNLSLIHI